MPGRAAVPLAGPSSSTRLAPTYILRAHAAPVSCLNFTHDGKGLISGDTDGYVAIWHLRTYRPRYLWKAHEGGILGLEEFDGGVLTQGRDNMVHLYRVPSSVITEGAGQGPSIDVGAATAVPSPAAPSPGFDSPAWSMDTNAMNFCRMHVLSLGPRPDPDVKGKGKAGPEDEEASEDAQIEALIAVPSLMKDDHVDVFHYPSKARFHRSIGKDAFVGQKTGSVMAVHLLQLPDLTADTHAAPPSTASRAGESTAPSSETDVTDQKTASAALHALIAYESGHLALFRFSPTSEFEQITLGDRGGQIRYHRPRGGKLVGESEGWDLVWVEKGHRDAVMSLAVDAKSRFAYTVAADHFLCKYRIADLSAEEAELPRIHVEASDSPGKSGVAIREDGKLLATAGWDGQLRLYSAKTLAPLAVLPLHRLSLQAIAFAPFESTAQFPLLDTGQDGGSSEEEAEDEGVTGRGKAWLATGGQEAKISLWEPYPVK